MKQIRNIILGVFFIVISTLRVSSQQDSVSHEISGYLNNLWSYSFVDDELYMDYLLHNRLKSRIYFPKGFKVSIDLRTRLFLGDQPKLIPMFANSLETTNDFFDLSIHSKANKNYLVHSMLDRFFVEWSKGDWELRLGRQRINWGITLAWNPQDIFNSYSFYDFDHIERPGSDAIRIIKHIGVNSKIELVSKMANNFDDLTSAALWKWNLNNYDLQVITGKAKEDVVAGFGWAGNIKNSGFKGETSLVVPYNNDSNLSAALLAALEFSHAFKNNFFLNYSFLFNGAVDDQSNTLLFNTPGDFRNLSPFKYSVLLQHTFVIRERFNTGLAIIYFPSKRNALYFSPSIQYSIAENWDLNLLGQFYFDKITGNYESQVNSFFFRLNFSF